MIDKKCHYCKHDRPLVDRSDVCATCHHFDRFQLKDRLTPKSEYEYKRLVEKEAWANDKTEKFDRPTALAVLKAMSEAMHPSTNIFGDKTLVIGRYDFELIRKKFLD